MISFPHNETMGWGWGSRFEIEAGGIKHSCRPEKLGLFERLLSRHVAMRGQDLVRKGLHRCGLNSNCTVSSPYLECVQRRSPALCPKGQVDLTIRYRNNWKEPGDFGRNLGQEKGWILSYQKKRILSYLLIPVD